jgi:hypothetical protein
MAEDIPITLSFESDEDGFIEFPEEKVTMTLPMTCLGPNTYRIDAVPVLIEAVSFGDIIEAEKHPVRGLRFLKVITPSNWKTYDFLLPAHLWESEQIKSTLDEVINLGGHWERIFGGVLYICVPPGIAYDPTPKIIRR